MTTQRTLVVTLVWAITAVGAVFMTLLAVSITKVEVSGPWLATFTALSAVVVATGSVGAIPALRRPGNVVGVVLQASGPLLVTTFCGFLLGAWFTEVNGPDDTLATVALRSRQRDRLPDGDDRRACTCAPLSRWTPARTPLAVAGRRSGSS